jgi:hypothetical protein
MPHTLKQRKIEDLLDKYKRAVDRRVCAQIDAGRCRTTLDWRNLHKAENNEYKVQDEVVEELCRAFGTEFKSAAGENDPEEEEE